MEFELSEKQLEFLSRLRRFLDDNTPPGLQKPGKWQAPNDRGYDTSAGIAFHRRLGQAGWLGLGFPEEYGGRPATAVEQLLFRREIDYRQLPAGGMGVWSVGRAILRFGTEEQKRRYLPAILGGDMITAIALAEPSGGTDLARAIQTRAVRDGDEYVVNGQKMFCSAAGYATHLWLAVRTGPPDSQHRALSMLIVLANSPGITVEPLITQAGSRTNMVYLDNVRVPVASRIGDENQGWRVILAGVELECDAVPFGDLERSLERLIAHVRTSPLAKDPVVRTVIARIAVDVDIAGLLAFRSSLTLDEGRLPVIESRMFKLWSAEVRQRLADAALHVMGSEGLACFPADKAPLGGYLESLYLGAPLLNFTLGGEMVRDLIAQRSLGLPRG